MRKVSLILPLLLALGAPSANAWFFFFLPGSVTSKIGDALTGAEGDSCVAATAKVGDLIKSPSGNTATVKSLSGTSSRCQQPGLPIRALLTFNYQFSSKAGINVPEGMESKSLTDMQRFHGSLLHAYHPTKLTGVFVASRTRAGVATLEDAAQTFAKGVIGALEDSKTTNEEEIQVKGMRALRLEIEGKTKDLWGRRYTYIVTVIQGAQEVLIVNAWAPTSDMATSREMLRQVALNVEGLASAEAVATPQPAASAAGPVAASVESSPRVPSAPASGPAQTIATVPSAEVNGPAASPATPSLPGAESVANRLRELDKLHREGILNREEYEAKKAQLLKSV